MDRFHDKNGLVKKIFKLNRGGEFPLDLFKHFFNTFNDLNGVGSSFFYDCNDNAGNLSIFSDIVERVLIILQRVDCMSKIFDF